MKRSILLAAVLLSACNPRQVRDAPGATESPAVETAVETATEPVTEPVTEPGEDSVPADGDSEPNADPEKPQDTESGEPTTNDGAALQGLGPIVIDEPKNGGGPPYGTPMKTRPRYRAAPEDVPKATKEQILAAFVKCPGTARLGQKADAPGTTCAEVCSLFGFQSCVRRNGQSGYETCGPELLGSGTCEDVFSAGWTSECSCGVAE